MIKTLVKLGLRLLTLLGITRLIDYIYDLRTRRERDKQEIEKLQKKLAHAEECVDIYEEQTKILRARMKEYRDLCIERGIVVDADKLASMTDEEFDAFMNDKNRAVIDFFET